MNIHQEMGKKVFEKTEKKLYAAGSKVTAKNIVSKINEISKETAEEMNLRYYHLGESTNFLFYDENHCIKVDWLHNPQVEAIVIAEEIIKLHQEFGSGIAFV